MSADLFVLENKEASPSANKSFSTSQSGDDGGSSSHSQEANKGWEKVRQKVMSVVGASLNFHTLRDMYGEVVLDPNRLKFISTIAGKHPSLAPIANCLGAL